MPATVEIIPIPLGSQISGTIRPGESADKNNFPVLLVFSENVAGLTEAGITLSAGSSLVSLEGKNSVWMATIRPPQTSGIVTVTVNGEMRSRRAIHRHQKAYTDLDNFPGCGC